MPLIKIENINSDCKWALWEITESFEELSSCLDLKNEAGQIESIKNESKKLEKLAGRILLKKILESWNEPYLGTDCDVYRKPFLRNKAYSISISHSHGLAVAIINKNVKIGIDIELTQDKIVKIAHRVFTEVEIGAHVGNIPLLITLWNMKEAIYKLYGERELDFRKNILILPFKFQENGGICEGMVRTKDIHTTLNITYLKYKDFRIAYVLDH
jgi:phosphopantetheinyl transferase